MRGPVEPNLKSAGFWERLLSSSGITKLSLKVRIILSIVAGLLVVASSSGWLVWNYYIKPVSLFARKYNAKEISEISRFLTNKGINHSVDGSQEFVFVYPWNRDRATSLLTQAHLPHRSAIVEPTSMSGQREREYYRHLREEERITEMVKQFSGVVDAEVIIAVSPEGFFKEEKQPNQASVTLHLEEGAKLSESQVESLMNMVSSSFPELKAENVTIVDANSGIEISKPLKDTDKTGYTAQNRIHTQELIIAESRRRAAEQILSGLGADKFRVSVVCVLDPSVEETNEKLLPNQSPNKAVGTNKKEEEYTKTSDETHYKVTVNAEKTQNEEIVHHVVRKTPKIENISAAVSFDNLNDELVAKFSPALRSALGIKDERGDQFAVANFPFNRPEIAPNKGHQVPRAVPQAPESTLPLLLSGMGLSVVAVGLLAWSKQNRRNSASRMVDDMQTTQPNTTLVDLLDDKMRASRRSDATQVAQQLQTITEMSPDAMAKLLKTSWLNKSGGN
jgi:flagellar biosynthesis/type III secretory pathway M-ring protein FliF/YscJ